MPLADLYREEEETPETPDAEAPATPDEGEERSYESREPSREEPTPSQEPEPIRAPQQVPQGGPQILGITGRPQGAQTQVGANRVRLQAQLNALPPALRSGMMMEMTKLSMGEQIRLQRLQQGLAYVDSRDDISQEDKQAYKMMLQTKINPYLMRQQKAQAAMTDMHRQLYEEQATRAHALNEAHEAQARKFRALSAQSPDGTFNLPGQQSRYMIGKDGLPTPVEEAKHVMEATKTEHKDAAAAEKAEAKIHTDWLKADKQAGQEADKEMTQHDRDAHKRAKEIESEDEEKGGGKEQAQKYLDTYYANRDGKKQSLVEKALERRGFAPTLEAEIQKKGQAKPQPAPGAPAPPTPPEQQAPAAPQMEHRPFAATHPHTMNPAQKQVMDDYQKIDQEIRKTGHSDANKKALSNMLDENRRLLERRGSVAGMDANEKIEYSNRLKHIDQALKEGPRKEEHTPGKVVTAEERERAAAAAKKPQRPYSPESPGLFGGLSRELE